MQAMPKRLYTLFLQSPCAYACGDREYVSTRSRTRQSATLKLSAHKRNGDTYSDGGSNPFGPGTAGNVTLSVYVSYAVGN
jgi:hypothetical protein